MGDRNDSVPIGLRHYAWWIAGPREFAIVAIVNGLIAWLLFGGRGEVGFAGDGGAFMMLVPMAFLLPLLSSFFGVLAIMHQRAVGRVTPTIASPTPWMGFAIGLSITRAGIGVAAMWILKSLILRWAFAISLSSAILIVCIAIGSGLAGWVLHATAMIRTDELSTRN